VLHCAASPLAASAIVAEDSTQPSAPAGLPSAPHAADAATGAESASSAAAAAIAGASAVQGANAADADACAEGVRDGVGAAAAIAETANAAAAFAGNGIHAKAAGAAGGEAQEQQLPRRWTIGDSVLVDGLKSRPELNGRQAKVVDTLPQPGGGPARLLVQVQGLTAHLAVKPDNLRPGPPAGIGADGVEGGGAARAAEAAGEGAEGARHFGANLDRLRARASAEASGRGRGRGKGGRYSHDDDPDQVLRQPVNFLPAADDHEPIRKVTVVDPRGRGVGDGMSDEELDFKPGRIKRPKLADPLAAEPIPIVRSWSTAQRPQPSQGVRSQDQPQDRPPQQPQQPQQPHQTHQTQQTQQRTPEQSPEQKPAAPEKPEPNRTPHFALSAGRRTKMIGGGGNLTLTVSDVARDEDHAKLKAAEQRVAAEEKRKKMLATLTQQIKVCLTRLQAGDLDDAGKEKYQDMVASLKAQMEKISGAPR